MLNINKSKIQTHWNRIRGIPLEFDLEKYEKILAKINEISLESASDSTLKEMSARLKEQAREGISLDNLLVEAFALVRETSRRTI